MSRIGGERDNLGEVNKPADLLQLAASAALCSPSPRDSPFSAKYLLCTANALSDSEALPAPHALEFPRCSLFSLPSLAWH